MKSSIVLSLFIITSFISCTQKVEKDAFVPTKESLSPSGIIDYSILPRTINFSKLPPSMDQSLSNERVITKARLFIPTKINWETKTAAPISWIEEDVKVKRFLEEHNSDPFAFYFRQRCALEMLCATTLLKDSSKEALSVIAYYTEMLAQENNPSAAVYVAALEKLENYWSKKKKQEIISVGVKQSQIAIQETRKLISRLKPEDRLYKGLKEGEKEYQRYSQLLVQRK